jgi:hypothetical protein
VEKRRRRGRRSRSSRIFAYVQCVNNMGLNTIRITTYSVLTITRSALLLQGVRAGPIRFIRPSKCYRHHYLLSRSCQPLSNLRDTRRTAQRWQCRAERWAGAYRSSRKRNTLYKYLLQVTLRILEVML